MLSTWAPRFIEPLRWLIIIGIAATLANTVLFFISGPETGTSSAPSDVRAAATQARKPTSINAILSRNLFGVVSTKTESSTVATVETRLPLELRGVFVGDEPEDSAAIVAQKGKAGELYSIGGILPGNAELVEVHPDHVVLRRAGNLEVLSFPDTSETLISDSEAYESADDSYQDSGYDDGSNEYQDNAFAPGSIDPNSADGTATTPREFVDTYRDRLENDPEGALSDLGIAPVNADGSGGYRLDNLAASPYLSQTGLQPGDVVLSVNGQPVGNIQQDRSQIDGILEQGSARLEVQRGTRRFFVTASLK